MPEDTDRNELVGPVLSWQGEVYRYIATYCGLAEAELFQIVNFMEAPPHIHEFPSKNHAEATRQLLPRVGNLRKIIDEYRKKRNADRNYAVSFLYSVAPKLTIYRIVFRQRSG